MDLLEPEAAANYLPDLHGAASSERLLMVIIQQPDSGEPGEHQSVRQSGSDSLPGRLWLAGINSRCAEHTGARMSVAGASEGHVRGMVGVMTTHPAASVPNPVQHRDAAVLIGILAVLDGAIWAGSFDEQTAAKVAERFAQEGLLAADYDQRDLRQALGDLNKRLRYAAGEYGSAPESISLSLSAPADPVMSLGFVRQASSRPAAGGWAHGGWHRREPVPARPAPPGAGSA